MVTAKYYGFDAGIDDDHWVLRKGMSKIEFAWTNWFEGEIRAKEEILLELEKAHQVKFKFGEVHSLKDGVALNFGVQSLPLWIVNKVKLFDRKL